MTVLELRAMLSRLPPDAEVLVSSAPLKEHGAFARSITGASQDRTVRQDGAERPVLVLHHLSGENGKHWAARTHGKPDEKPVAMRARHRGHDIGTMMIRTSIVESAWADRLACMATLWGQGDIDLWATVQDGWRELVFQGRAEAVGFAERCEGITVAELVAR